LKATAAVLLLLVCGPAAVSAQEIRLPRPSSPAELSQRLQQAWAARDAAAYLALWSFAGDEERQREAQFAAVHFAADELVLQAQAPRVGRGGQALVMPVQLFTVSEPRARLEDVLFEIARQADGWVLRDRDDRPGIEGLMHLSLAPQAYKADGLKVRFEDFELDLHQGSLFTTPQALGPTVLVFVGRATARFSPRPEEEKEQLRQFSGRREMVEAVSAAFVRIHPADFHRVFVPGRLEEDPAGAARYKAARKVFDEHATESFVLDAANFPRSPWWLLPGVGEASVAFHSGRGTLTYTLSANEPEGISLFDRPRQRQICLYPREGRDTDYNEDETRPVDVLEHDLRLRFDPQRFLLQAEDTLKFRLDMATPSLRLRLHEDFTVQSVSSLEGGQHLFFRIRHQDGLLVSLGALSGHIGEVTLTVRYSGLHQPVPVERELMQRPVADSDAPGDEDVVIDPALVYSNRTAWYPQFNADDFALARLRIDLPPDYMALTGGQRTRTVLEGGRNIVEYVQDQPSKYITVAVGRFSEVGRRQISGVSLEVFSSGRTRRDAAEMLELAAAVLPFFESQFGPLPYHTLRLAVLEGYTPGGHSPPGMIVLAQRPALMRRSLRPDPAGFWDVPGFFFAHELAHQWWGHGVAGQNYRERWISESFAQFAAALWTRQRLGEEKYRQVLERMSSWALRFGAAGPIHLGYRLGHVKSDPQIFRGIVYDKGACVLEMIEGVVGAEAFRAGLRALQEKFRFQKVGTEDVRRALEESSGKELAPYFQAWVMGTALPRLEVRHLRQDGTTTVEVRAQALPGPVPLQITLVTAGGREAHVVQLPPEGGRFTFETKAPVRRVEVNQDGGLLLAGVTQR
jgi:peptidase M1-like protein